MIVKDFPSYPDTSTALAVSGCLQIPFIQVLKVGFSSVKKYC